MSTEETNEETNNDQLLQFLGISLRGVMPYAESEVGQIHEVARRDSDAEAAQEAAEASEAITRAQRALDVLEETELAIKALSDDAFDDDFQVQFDD